MASRTVEIPAVGFRFSVSIDGQSGNEASFTEVSGISAVISTEEIVEGGENRYKHRLPSTMTYPPLVLKRGIMKKDSELVKWVLKILQEGYSQAIETKTLGVELLDEEGQPIKEWSFEGAYPLKYEVAGLKSDANQLAIETLEFSYRIMTEG